MPFRDQQRRYLRVPSSNLTSEVQTIRSSPSVADAKDKLGVMIPGMGGSGDNLCSWRGSSPQGHSTSHRLYDADGYHPPGEAHRGAVSKKGSLSRRHKGKLALRDTSQTG